MWHLIVFPSHGNHLSKEFVFEKIFQIGKDFGMITSRKIFGRSQRVANREVVKRTYLLSVRQGREKERVLARRVTLMENHPFQGRRRT
jgi:hypothetical protein